MKTSRRWAVVGAAAAVAGAAAVGALLLPDREANSAQIALGQEIYRDNCARCHGANLEGQPDWRMPMANGRLPAPPHDASGHTWHHSDADLFTITKEGMQAFVPDYDSDMPAFGGILTDDEIRAAIAFIRSTWPQRQREYQAARGQLR